MDYEVNQKDTMTSVDSTTFSSFLFSNSFVRSLSDSPFSFRAFFNRFIYDSSFTFSNFYKYYFRWRKKLKNFHLRFVI